MRLRWVAVFATALLGGVLLLGLPAPAAPVHHATTTAPVHRPEPAPAAGDRRGPSWDWDECRWIPPELWRWIPDCRPCPPPESPTAPPPTSPPTVPPPTRPPVSPPPSRPAPVPPPVPATPPPSAGPAAIPATIPATVPPPPSPLPRPSAPPPPSPSHHAYRAAAEPRPAPGQTDAQRRWIITSAALLALAVIIATRVRRFRR